MYVLKITFIKPDGTETVEFQKGFPGSTRNRILKQLGRGIPTIITAAIRRHGGAEINYANGKRRFELKMVQETIKAKLAPS